jgi:hypothetical protein
VNNITLTCPVCHYPDKAVGNPDEKDEGASGKWYCFNCGSSGTYDVEFNVTHDLTGVANEPPSEYST